jgi:hypothetical protein
MVSQQKRTILGYALAICLCVVGIVLANVWFRKSDAERQLAEANKSRSEILGAFQKSARVATTEVKLKRIAVYDSDTDFSGFNPANWKVGRRACILPVEMTVKYGIDLNKMKVDDIIIDSARVVKVRLPKPEVISYDVDPRINRDDVVTITSLLRADVGEPTLRRVKEKCVEEMRADTTVFSKLSADIEGNTRRVMGAIVRGMGYVPEFIH